MASPALPLIVTFLFESIGTVPAIIFTAIAFFKVISLRKNNKAIFHVVVNYIIILFFVITTHHLNINCVGPIPAANEVFKLPEAL